MSSKHVLVVGAGFAGAVYARTAAEAGHRVTVIDRRDHVAGNAYDAVGADGVRVHRYGPHLFHTSNRTAVDWLGRFTELVPYEHEVEAELPGGRCVPLPINRQTINHVFDQRLETPEQVRDFLAKQAEPIAEPRNAAEHLNAHVGRTLTDLFFRPYTKKMWALDLEELDAAVVKRIPLRLDDERRYFPNDAFQFLPRHGYTAAFEAMFDHPDIAVSTGVAYDHSLRRDFDHCFNSMPIDEFYDFELGALPYRSIRFHHHAVDETYRRGSTPVVNFTDSGPLTRETDWSRLPGHHVTRTGTRTITREEPCDYRDNDMERYYPVKTSDGRYDALYRRYRERSERETDMDFIGRCGTYQYLDMHQVINQSLLGVEKWLARQG